MCWLVEKERKEYDDVSVAGCLGYDVLGLVIKFDNKELGFSCWLFRL